MHECVHAGENVLWKGVMTARCPKSGRCTPRVICAHVSQFLLGVLNRQKDLVSFHLQIVRESEGEKKSINSHWHDVRTHLLNSEHKVFKIQAWLRSIIWNLYSDFSEKTHIVSSPLSTCKAWVLWLQIK